MSRPQTRFYALIIDEDGQGLVEYGMVLSLVSVVCVSSLVTVGGTLDPSFMRTAAALRTAVGP